MSNNNNEKEYQKTINNHRWLEEDWKEEYTPDKYMKPAPDYQLVIRDLTQKDPSWYFVLGDRKCPLI